jgi:PrcB C-terminal
MMGFLVMLALTADPAVMTVARGPMSAVADARQTVARTVTEWGALWKSHGAAQPMPDVDFSTSMVAAVFLGSQPTGGISVEITGTRLDGDALVVEFVERRPGRGDVVSQVLTSPFHVVKLPRHDGPVRFEKQPAGGAR